jgi:hypothetical protein
MSTTRSTRPKALALVMVLTVLGGCTPVAKESGLRIEQMITGVTDGTGTVHATLRSGEPPSPNGGPTNTVAGFAAMVNGGSAQTTITGSAAFTRVVVAIPGAINYYEIQLPSGSTSPVVIQASPELPKMTMAVTYAVGDPAVVGDYTAQNVQIVHVGTGDVQVSASWSDTTDVDLYVVDPNGEEIYYGHKNSASGGILDLDSNAACSRDSEGQHKSNENTVWPTGGGARGNYTVRLNYWSSCGVSLPTQWVVTVATAGGGAQVFTGSFTPPGVGGGSGAGQVVTTFTY